MDPATRAAREHANEVLRRGLLAAENDPMVAAARDNLAAIENHNPRHDNSIHEARAHLAEVQSAYDGRQATSDKRIEELQRIIGAVRKADPFQGDDELRRTQTDLAGMRARLGAAAENDPAFRARDAQRREREAYLVDLQHRIITESIAAVEAERDHLGAPKVTADDVTRARQAAEQAPVAAQEQHRAAVEKAQADLDRAVAAARQAVEQSQAVVEANASAASAADAARNGPHARMEKEADPTFAKLAGDIAKLSGVLADYDKAHATAYNVSHPMFTRPGMGPGETPAVDYSHSAVPRTGPAFGPNGPMVDTSALAGTLSASIMRAIYPEREPQKVDVSTIVSGKVDGKADVTGKVDVAVQPSRYFEGMVRRAEVAGTMALHGEVTGAGGGDYMGGPSGVVQYPGGVHPAGR